MFHGCCPCDEQGANPAAVGPINDGKQRMWLPDEGWVEVEAVEAQEGTPDEREAGYNAYSDDPATAAEDMERAEREKAVSEEVINRPARTFTSLFSYRTYCHNSSSLNDVSRAWL